MNIDITLTGVKEVTSSLKYVDDGLSDFRKLGTFDAIAAEFYKIEKETFSAEGGPSGKWKALSPAYAAIKAKKYGNVPILTATGQMMKSLTSRGAANSVMQQTATEMTIGTSDPKAGYHQRGNRRLPQRKVIDFDDARKERLNKVAERKIKQLIANAKLRSARGS